MTKSLQEAIGFYRGWAEARGMDVKVMERIDTIIEHALQNKDGGNAEIERQRNVIARLSAQLNKDKQELMRYKPELEERKQRQIDKDTVIAAIKDGLHDERLLPASHEREVRCMTCQYLQNIPGSKLRACTKFGIKIKRSAAKRECRGHIKAPLHDRLPIKITCRQCRAYDKMTDSCRALGIAVENPNANRYAQCPYWTSIQPQGLVKFNNDHKKIVDNYYKKGGK